MPLQQKYRPQNLDEIFGNDSTVKALRSVLGREDKPFAFLFFGERGCGKTTLGRIVKDMLGCSDLDFREIDGASASGKDTILQIQQLSRYAPIKGGCKVFLIDECHGISGKAKDAFLKELEEPPSNVYYILCTTEPQKLTKAIKSRCTPFPVAPLGFNESERLLKWVLKEEGVEGFPEKDLKEIIEAGEGVPREMLVILDKVIDLPDEDVGGAIETTSYVKVEAIELCRALLKGESWGVISPILKSLKETGEDAEGIRRLILSYFTSVQLGAKNSQELQKVSAIKENFIESFFYTGFSGLVQSCAASVLGV